MSDPIWYALQVRSSRELAIAKDLRMNGHTVFVPVEMVIRLAHNGRNGTTRRESMRALVTGYVFCDEAWPQHKEVRGVIMADADRPYLISQTAMIPLLTASGRERHEGVQLAPLTIGQIVKLDGGPFDGKAVTIAKLVAGKIVVQIDVLGGRRQVQVRREQIAA